MNAGGEAGSGDDVVALPFPSLAAELIPTIKEMEQSLQTALAQFDQVPTWDAQQFSHEEVVASAQELKQNAQEWVRSMHRKLASLWMETSTQYNTYRSSIDHTLRRRHAAEIDFLFPSMRTTLTELPPLMLQNAPDEMVTMCRHLFRHGFLYDDSLEGSSKKVSRVVARHLKERSVFDATTLRHSEQLLHAKRVDITRLEHDLTRVNGLIDALMTNVERKVAASRRTSTHTLYHRHSGSAKHRTPAPPQNPQQQQQNVSSSMAGGNGGASVMHQAVPPSFQSSGLEGSGSARGAPVAEGVPAPL